MSLGYSSSLSTICSPTAHTALGERRELRLNPQLVNPADETAEIVAKNFRQRLILLRRFGLAAERIPELALDHHHGRFDVGPLVVVGKEFILAEAEVVQ